MTDDHTRNAPRARRRGRVVTTIVVPLHRAEVLTANGRLGHWAMHRAKQSLRATGVVRWRQAGSPQLDRAHCVVTVSCPPRGVRDIANVAPTSKVLIDAYVHPARGVRGLLPDDSDAYLVGPDHRRGAPTGVRDRYVFRFTFEELP